MSTYASRISTSAALVSRLGAALLSAALVGSAYANPGRDQILAGFANSAKARNPGFSKFSAARGKSLFETRHGSGKPATPACITCHGQSPENRGETRTGKPIEPMAVSSTPGRFTDRKKVQKWFRRNCRSVLGRECTALEKGNFITFMMSQ